MIHTPIRTSTAPHAFAGPSLVTSWDDERDVAFFRCVAHLFSPAFTSGASALLASYDRDQTAIH